MRDACGRRSCRRRWFRMRLVTTSAWRWKQRLISFCATGLLGAAGSVLAHHSFAVFDQSKEITIVGTVKEFQYTNPHGWIDVLVPGAQGVTEEWGVETGPPSQLRQQGWNKDSVKPGDKFTVVIHPRRDGTKIGSLMVLTLVDGTVLGRRPEPPAESKQE